MSMGKNRAWIFLVFGVLVVSLCFGCSLISKGIGPIPPMDAYNNMTGERGADGKTDLAYIEYLHGLKVTADSVTVGASAPASSLLELIITGISSVAVAVVYAASKDKADKKEMLAKGEADKKEVMDEIRTTDKNLDIVAEHAKVSQEKLS